jgi:phosphoribosyl 1,2-cyclic phosphate phosphodiesterase
MDQLRVTILGCGSSGGVPRLGISGAQWGDCDPENPKNRRRRCSLLVERIGAGGTTRVLIDTSPDLREQLIAAGIGQLDGVVYTHSHADHVHGIDDLRAVVLNMHKRLPIWADPPTSDALVSRFGYAFVQPEGSPYPSILDLRAISGPFEVPGAGGPIPFVPFHIDHGAMEALGFRIRDLAYLPDVVRIPDQTWPHLEGLQVWILDALRRKPHPTHAHLDLSLEWIARMGPAQAILTNMHIDLDYETLCAELPAHIRPAYDGMSLTLALSP